jgi:CRISPR-associated protein Csd2
MSLQRKIDFALIFSVTNANPNGDPLAGNRPRVNYDGIGEVSDVCLKRKIRNRLIDIGENIFVRSDDYRFDDYATLLDRVMSVKELETYIETMSLKKGKRPKEFDEIVAEKDFRQVSNKTWFDVRCFGQVFPFKKPENKKKDKQDDKSDDKTDDKSTTGISVGIRGPVSIQSAYSLEQVDITSLQITKSVSLKPDTDSDTMGRKHRVDKGIYVTYGSINCQLAELTGFSEEDAEKLKQAMLTIFENDASAARPDGSMEVCKLVWWEHNCKNGQYSAAKVHRSLREIINPDGNFDESVLKTALPDLSPEILSGR